jgi:hypothetical protein
VQAELLKKQEQQSISELIEFFLSSVRSERSRETSNTQNTVQRCSGSINGIVLLSFRAAGCAWTDVNGLVKTLILLMHLYFFWLFSRKK